MLKCFLTFLVCLISLNNTPVITKTENFMNKINNAYEQYEEIDSYSNSEYNLVIVRGINNQTPCYGICFTSVEAQKYYLVVKIDGQRMTLETDSRKDSLAYAIKAASEISIEIYDKDGNLQSYEKSLPKFSKSDLTNTVKGENQGIKESTLTIYAKKSPFLLAFIIVLSSIILVSGVLILILFILRKGMFNKATRKSGVINIRDLVNEQTFDNPKENYFENMDQNQTKDDSINEDEKPTSSNKPSTKIKDIKAYLQDKGFVTDYRLLSEEEKNKIMIELIKLKIMIK